ncbi:MAG: asparagine synthase (glutamine-hydrolyzing) [Kiritimatiellae bacterium]|nr:asparagine synthase (glutamine-hydrolyzing) [Kiritimatiellia bacterium]
MCGIAGFTTFHKRLPRPDDAVRAMTATLVPRGPDGEGYHVADDVALGHRRLSIIDLEGGAQPMAADDGRYQLIFNGEIYNYIELREELEKRGRAFRTKSDAEVLLQQFAADGLKALDCLNGIFAFAVWDQQTRTLCLARDRLGVKPLYYAVCDGDLVFASELKALLKHPGIRREIDLLSVSKFFTFGYIPAPHTIFKGVHKLEPGAYLRFGEHGLHKGIYWDIPMEDNPISGRNVDECAADIIEILQDAVRKQLRSDVPVGVFLSGGIDSSAITALAARAASTRLHSFSVGFEESSYDESPYALTVARRYGTEHHHEVLSIQRAVKLLPDVMRILDEPFGDASIIPTYLLSKFTSEHVKVVLGGDGGDELFAGYPSFQAHKLAEKMSFLPTTWRDGLTRLARRIPVSHHYASVDFLVQQFLKGAGISPEIRFFMWMGCYGNDQKARLFTDDVRRSLLRTNPFEDVINYVRQSGLVNDFQRILYLCMKMYMQDQCLVKVDRASMAHSLEVRVPFLDHNLVEYACSIQSVYKLKGFTTKYVLKRAMRDILPRQIIRRRKAGFMIPLAKWLKEDLRDLVEDTCSPQALGEDGLFNPDYVRQMVNDHVNHVRDYRKQLWTLLCFQLWRRNYGQG